MLHRLTTLESKSVHPSQGCPGRVENVFESKMFRNRTVNFPEPSSSRPIEQ